MRRPSFLFVKAATYTAISAMRSTSTWVNAPEKYNELLMGLLMTADNLAAGRPSSEDPDSSASWGQVEAAVIHLAFTLLAEVAERRGHEFFSCPEAAAASLQRIALHFHGLNILGAEPENTNAWMSERAARYDRIDPVFAQSLRAAVANRSNKSQQPDHGFSYAPIWPLEPIAPEEAEPLVVTDGYCGHGGTGMKQSKCHVCGEAWLKAYRASLEKRREWEGRQEQARVAAGRVRTAAENLLQERRRELFGVKECNLPHARKHKRGDLVVSSDGLRTWEYIGEDDSDPAFPFHWQLVRSNVKGGLRDKSQIAAWNETGIPA